VCLLPELSLTVPIVNTLAFLFTVIGEWWLENKVISRGRYSLRAAARPIIKLTLLTLLRFRYPVRHAAVIMWDRVVCA
jgi:hypothetical protein